MNHRVLHIIASLEHSGAAAQLLSVVAGQVRRGVVVQVVALRDGGLRHEFLAVGAKVQLLTRRHRFDPLVAWRLKQLADQGRCSVTHAWDTTSAAFAHAAGVGPLVVTARNADEFALDEDWLSQRVARSIRHYLAASQSIADALLTAGVPSEQVCLAPPAISPRTSKAALGKQQAFDELALPTGARTIAVVGRLVPTKNVRELIWCADLVRVLQEDVRLVIFGGGPLRGELERFARMVSDREHIRFVGQRGDLPDLLPHFEMLWHAGGEASPPQVVLEAMAAGVPVVADHTPGASEAIVDGETGLLVPVAARAARARVTQQLFDEPDRRRRLSAAARQRALENFNVTNLLDRFTQAYEAVQPEYATTTV